VCHLKKAIYGLKQAHRAWFHRFNSFLFTHGFTCSQSDSSISLLSLFISTLSKQFALKDLGDLHYFLGVQVTHSPLGNELLSKTSRFIIIYISILKQFLYSYCLMKR